MQAARQLRSAQTGAHLSLHNVAHALAAVAHEVAQRLSSHLQQPHVFRLLKQMTQQQAEARRARRVILHRLQRCTRQVGGVTE